MLDPSKLTSDLAALFASYPSPSDAARGMASAYCNYAAAATFGASTIEIATALCDALSATLLSAIADPLVGLPATFVDAWVTGLTALWIGVPVVGAQAGATVGCPGAASMPAALLPVLTNLANTAQTGAAGLAAALHTATMTVTATVAPPPNTVVSIA